MAPAIVRKTATKVRDGQVDRKNRSTLSEVHGYSLKKVPAGRGFTHVVSATQLERFIGLIPGWEQLSHRLDEIILDHGERGAFGYHVFSRRYQVGVIALCAWPKELWTDLSMGFYRENERILTELGVRPLLTVTKAKCRFTVAQARAFSLLNVFMHELGHHRDRHRRPAYGVPGREEFAEDFANSWLSTMLPRYREEFGDPAVKGDDEAEV